MSIRIFTAANLLNSGIYLRWHSGDKSGILAEYANHASTIATAALRVRLETIMEKDRRSIRSMTIGWLGTLALFTALAFGSAAVLEQEIAHEAKVAESVNRSAAQRTYGQRIALLAMNYVQAGDPALRHRIEHELLRLSDIMQDNLHWLSSGEGPAVSLELKKRYFEPPLEVHRKTSAFLAHVRQLTEAKPDSLALQNPHVYYITAASTELLESWGEVTNQYEREGEQGIERLRAIEHGIIAATILVVLVAAGLIFWPMTRQLSRELQKRSRHEEKLRKISRDLRKTAADLRRVNGELEQFAGAVAHDLRAPLINILTSCRMLSKRIAEQGNEEQLQLLQYLNESAERADILIRELLNYARATSEELPRRRVDVGTVIEEIVFDLTHTLNEAGAQVTIMDLPPVIGDKSRLRQLFQNLVQNSLRYRDNSRPLVIRVFSLAHGGDEKFVTFVVEDNGRGFPSERAKEIFQPFRRFNSEGVGLGLALCKRIAQAYGGDVRAVGRPNKGASFLVRLPVWSPSVVKSEHETSSDPDEDDEDIELSGVSGSATA